MENKYSNNQKTIYQIFPRNHTKEGTFKAIIKDLDRIKDLGVDIIYLLPIHTIGIEGRKGTYGSPYAVRDYYSISEDLGTLADFIELINEIHKRDMIIIMDMVFNHTAIDSVLTLNHDEYYDHDDNHNHFNKAGGWLDVIDLNTHKKEVENYLVDVCKYWVNIGVDGFRFDVASFVNINVFKRLRKEIKKELFLLAESVHLEFGQYMRDKGYYSFLDEELHPLFDSSYSYNTIVPFEEYLYDKTNTLLPYKQRLLEQEVYMPKGFNKLTCIENHDMNRVASISKNKMQHVNLITYSFINKGCNFIYAGEEYGISHKPELFEKDPLVINDDYDKDIYKLIKKLISLKHMDYFKEYLNFTYIATNEHTIGFKFNDINNNELLCLFNLSSLKQDIEINENGKYIDLLTGKEVIINKSLKLDYPLVLLKAYEKEKNN